MRHRLGLPARALLAGLIAGLAAPQLAAAQSAGQTAGADADAPVYGPRLEGFDYAYPVGLHSFTSQREEVEMAYIDVAPQGEANGRTALLLHGKNFCAGTWEDTIAAMSEAGWRVIAVDQIGFCKSSKPWGYQYSFDQLAANTKQLLDALEVDQAVVLGHSMGGMLATRFALMFPERTEQLVFVNAIGLEDVRGKGLPYASVEQLFQGKLNTTYDSIRRYQEQVYYPNGWQDRYDRWVHMAAGPYRGEGASVWGWAQAKTDQMVYAEPVVHDYPRIEVPTLLMMGMQDRTAPGRNRADEALAAELGDYPALVARAMDTIPDAHLVAFEDLGHSPQVEAPDRFHAALLEALDRPLD